MAFIHFSLSLSKETLKISNLSPLYLLYSLTTLGFSTRQGPHQDAQKSIKTYFPRKDDNFISSPSGLTFVISGAIFSPCSLHNHLDFAPIAQPENQYSQSLGAQDTFLHRLYAKF